MNRTNVMTLIEHLENTSPDHFNMAYPPDCIVGHVSKIVTGNPDELTCFQVWDWLGLDRFQGVNLFSAITTPKDLRDISLEDVLLVLHNLHLTGKIEWSKIT